MIKLKKITAADNAKVAQMIRGVFEEYGVKKEGTVYSDPTTNHLFELFENENAVFFLAEENGEILGSCGIFPTPNLPLGCAELVKFYVSRKIRGTGIGRKLYKKSEAWAIATGYQQLYIESLPDFMDAVRIYKKIGFKLRNKSLGNSGHFGCNIWMTKELKSK